ncbi:hypothetical protein Pan44_07580 [Caulifigura coniformis]|uniref:Uncharacterized protein n=1 Tax=Caulifigura coniformis TaxID=2527983 RepID=A0A517S9H0_9PLAN|nr:hypothetical protein [Caulifigura coniformis]QDT52746.1 hypothetical protein Pan44_07580 [Caulifigura coniformis]
MVKIPVRDFTHATLSNTDGLPLYGKGRFLGWSGPTINGVSVLLSQSGTLGLVILSAGKPLLREATGALGEIGTLRTAS